MTLAMNAPAFSADENQHGLALPILCGWLMFAALSAYKGWATLMGPGLVDPDALVRLAQIRDFLSGQGWYDVTQLRMNAPFGVAMHWSRVIDLPVSGLILGLSQIFARDMAERLALGLWPLILSLGYVSAVVMISVRLAGRGAAWPAVFLALL